MALPTTEQTRASRSRRRRGFYFSACCIPEPRHDHASHAGPMMSTGVWCRHLDCAAGFWRGQRPVLHGAGESSAVPLKIHAGLALMFRPLPAASWPNACAAFAVCRKANRSGKPDAAWWFSLDL
jgi:hypothetical protein